MRQKWEIHPHCHGPWLLKIGSRSYLVPAQVGRQLTGPDAGSETPAGLAELLAAESEGPSPGEGRVWMWLRLPILPPRLVRVLTGRLTSLCSVRMLAAQGVGGLGLIVFSLSSGLSEISGQAIPAWPVALFLFLVSALWHELGHAAALAREGYPPGVIGVGMLLVIPVLYSDVTAVAALDRGGRTRVNLGGVCFHLAGGGLLALTGWAIHWRTGLWPAALLVAELSILAAVVWSLTPFFRSDGYWLLTDLLGLPDLERSLEPSTSPASVTRTRLLAGGLVAYRLAHAAFLAWIGFLLPLRYLAKLQILERWLPGLMQSAPAKIVLGSLVLLLWVGMGRRILALLRSCWLDLLTALAYHPK